MDDVPFSTLHTACQLPVNNPRGQTNECLTRQHTIVALSIGLRCTDMLLLLNSRRLLNIIIRRRLWAPVTCNALPKPQHGLLSDQSKQYD